MTQPIDDFMHYFNATGRLSKEVIELRAEIERLGANLRNEIDRLRYYLRQNGLGGVVDDPDRYLGPVQVKDGSG